MAKLTLREFTRQFPSKEEERRFTEAMNAPSDLIVAVLHGIELDYLLEQDILIKLERWDDETAEILSKDNGQISTFFCQNRSWLRNGIIRQTENGKSPCNTSHQKRVLPLS